MTRKSAKSAYDAGANACARGGGGEKNPHNVATPDSKAWEHGYLDRQKVMSNDRRPPSASGKQPASGVPAHQ